MNTLQPGPQGLYDPWYEHDACGVGFVVDLKNRKSHDIVEKGLQVLLNLQHRGACGCEANTGDGAGILLQMPHKFFAKETAKLGFLLPNAGDYGVGMVFLPREAQDRARCEQLFEKIVRDEGQKVLGWRDVPTSNQKLGPTAVNAEPVVRQIFIGKVSGLPVDTPPESPPSQGGGGGVLAFERKLYVIRKMVENEIRRANISQKDMFYVPSLSCKTVIYKGMLNSDQVLPFYADLKDPGVESALALVHSRFSTNTFPNWARAHPYRYLAHNGEINTLRGNINWMHARESMLASDLFGEDIKKILPIIDAAGSDSAMFDNVLEMLVLTGRSLPHAVMMMIPEPWSGDATMPAAKRAFYEYHSALMEPWDGPASIAFTDGIRIGAVLDRNGLRPSRYYVTKDGLVIMASEVGVLDVPPEDVLLKGRLQPGKMFLVDLEEGRIIADEELKAKIAIEQPYAGWLKQNLTNLEDLPEAPAPHEPDHETVMQRQQAFGYTVEDVRILMAPMAQDGTEAIGSMGNDASLAVLSDKPQLLYNYFKQLFAQVTNPPVDCIREECIMSMATTIGREYNLLNPTPQSCRQIMLKSPILLNHELDKLRQLEGTTRGRFKSITLPSLYHPKEGAAGLERELTALCRQASSAIATGTEYIILSDRAVDKHHAPIPALLAIAAVHHHLIREGTRTQVSLVLESGEPREVHHFCLLIGYGAGAINPYLAFETIEDMIRQGHLKLDPKKAIKNYVKSIDKGVLKVMSKMGISTAQSYCGAQIFEAIGLGQDVIDKYFTWTPSRVGGVGLDVLAQEVRSRHDHAFSERPTNGKTLDVGGHYQYRKEGEYHLFNPETVHKLQYAVRANNYKTFKEYTALVNNQATRLATLRGLMDINFGERQPVPMEEVESVESIMRRFKSGAMSYGSISKEAHETLAIAMNRIGGKSNTGEGGEDPERYHWTNEQGDSKNSAIKQVASGRFGVNSEYLVMAKELQIKMAQGAKPGEGGQLPGHKVYPWIAKVRLSTPGVGLISPPPHHDIYSIEDLAELIHDLKNSNEHARISVKLVAEVGVGTVAAGVSKAHADVVLISGYDGGTGASPLTSIKHAGVPWELGLAETQQVLVLNNLRSRIVVEVDGQLKTGRDVIVGALLGGEEFGFATAPLVALGCIMMRVCHLNTCPVGVATQDPRLRAKFAGKPEHVAVNFMRFIAEEVRELMAQLGFRKFEDMIGRSELLGMTKAIAHYKALGLDFSKIFYQPEVAADVGRFCNKGQEHGLEKSLDKTKLLELCKPAIDEGKPVKAKLPIKNIHRVVGTITGSEITRKWGAGGLPDDTIQLNFTGSAGQSFGAFVPRGMTMTLEGDANDYFGKGLSGGKLVVYPPQGSTYVAEENVIIGNVAFYGATSGEAYIRGLAGERFCVRNSGVNAVVEAVGDHGCEYMTGGRVVILGPTGKNFAAGMSGGIAYVLDEKGDFRSKVNPEMVTTFGLEDEEEIELVRSMIKNHAEFTRSDRARHVLAAWAEMAPKFVKVYPNDFRRVVETQKRFKAQGLSDDEAIMAAFDENAHDAARVGGKRCIRRLRLSVGHTPAKPQAADWRSLVGKPTGFLEFPRELPLARPPAERVADWGEFHDHQSVDDLRNQGARCMDCGVPFCHTGALLDGMASGCPINNLIPEWNDLVYRGLWREALERLHKTNNFPEFTGRVCPAPCEGSCVLGITEPAVTIKNIECSIIDHAFEEGWVQPEPPLFRTGKKVAVVGSGPAGLAAAAQLNKAGHWVTVFERADRIGGLLMYGIPNMKLDKKLVVERRVKLMQAEGVKFITNCEVGVNYPAENLVKDYHAVVLAGGATKPRDLPAPGRELKGIHFAMDFLTANTKSLLDSGHADGSYISAKGKDVIVIGGGDTGTDCVGTAMRHGCKSLVQFEILPKPPLERAGDNPWPQWPKVYKLDYGQEEAAAIFGDDPRTYLINTKKFVGDDQGHVKELNTVRVDWVRDNGKFQMREVPGSEQVLPAQLVLLAMGFLGPEDQLLQKLGVERDPRSNVKAEHGKYATSIPGVFAAGDMRRGQSLIVWAINEGRGAARECDRWFMGETVLP